jgi:hypothetical protein
MWSWSGADPGREASVDEQMQWLNTASGQSFLNELSSPLPKHMYMSKSMHKIIWLEYFGSLYLKRLTRSLIDIHDKHRQMEQLGKYYTARIGLRSVRSS